jgi:nicotinate-nucleotide--dimethylbenzimidazole phosphoribosyltransferase
MADSAPASFEEIRAVLLAFPEPDADARAAAAARDARLTKPAGALGRLEELVQWLAGWQGRHPPRIERPFTAVFVGNHGIAARGVSAYPAEVTKQMLQNFIDGGAAVNQLCGVADSDLRVYELALDEPTRDFSVEPAMTEDDCVRAVAYGMMSVEPGVDLLALGEMGIGNTTSAAALCHALHGGSASDWVGRGTGIDDAGLANKTALIAAAVEMHRPVMTDPLAVLRCLGGFELAAILGAVMAARMAQVPVVLDGYACTAAAAILHALDSKGLDHCVVAHASVEPGHRRLLARIGKQPLFDLGLRLGEASGAVLAIPLLKAACACHAGMATFDEAGVSGPA